MLIRNICILLMSLLGHGLAHATSKEPLIISFAGGVERAPYAELIESTYKELGYDTIIVDIPAKRGLLQLNKGAIDADVVRLKKNAELYPNIIVIEPAITSGVIALVCAQGVKCDPSLLKNEDVEIYSHEGIVTQLGNAEVTAKIISHERMFSIIDMLVAQRGNYALYACDFNTLNNLPSNLTAVTIKTVYGYHVISKKIAHLRPLIEAKIEEKLPEFHATLRTYNKQ
ncbi:hypothetical protein [Paraglaciecola sp. 2405UD69-4]|uniref:hypothetical protein n=1 Tax=Paraglaciecola sp. 2405UD69-4 TaxID=3391836 RepID=UPI0039C9149F